MADSALRRTWKIVFHFLSLRCILSKSGAWLFSCRGRLLVFVLWDFGSVVVFGVAAFLRYNLSIDDMNVVLSVGCWGFLLVSCCRSGWVFVLLFGGYWISEFADSRLRPGFITKLRSWPSSEAGCEWSRRDMNGRDWKRRELTYVKKLSWRTRTLERVSLVDQERVIRVQEVWRVCSRGALLLCGGWSLACLVRCDWTSCVWSHVNEFWCLAKIGWLGQDMYPGQSLGQAQTPS